MTFFARMILFLVISFSLVEIPLMKAAHADTQMITTSVAIEDFNRTQEVANLDQFINRADVKEQLIKLGVSPEEASKRLASLSNDELKKLQSDIDQHTAGGDVVGVLVIVVLVLLVIYLFKRV